jgi:hypothetical protein
MLQPPVDPRSDRDVPGRAGGAVALVVFILLWIVFARRDPLTGVALGWLPAMFGSWAAGLGVTVLIRARADAHARRAASQRTTQGAEAP